jgi:3-methyl-2-oxobutanoate hydroxymethyltransferase
MTEDLSREITSALNIITIGIGSGPHCDGQVLVVNDLLGYTEKAPSFAKPKLDLKMLVQNAARSYRDEVKALQAISTSGDAHELGH